MSLTVQRPMTIREQGRAIFADVPETPNAGYFFSHFQESDGNTVWCRANRTARGGPVYHFVKVLNPQDLENRQFRVVDTSQLNQLERRQFMAFEDFLLNREGELALQEINMQSEEQRRTFAVIREQQADIRQGLVDIRQGLVDMGQQQSEIRQQHTTLERQIGALEQQNATFEQQNATFEQQNATFEQQNATFEQQNTTFQQQNAYFRVSNSRKDALIEQVQTSKIPQATLGIIRQAHTTHAASSVQQIPTGTANSSAPNAILGFSPSAPLPSTDTAVPSSPMSNHVLTPNAAFASHPVANEIHQALVPLSSVSTSHVTNRSHQQQVSEQENASTPSANETDLCSPIINFSADGNPHTSQDNDEPSFWRKVQDNISSLFAQIFSNIKQGWEYFISLL